MQKDNYFILTGAPGTGKSSVLDILKARGYCCIDESARAIIAEQKAINGDGVYEKNPQLFIELMLARSVETFQNFLETNIPVVFDRGIPDIIAYAKLSGNDSNNYLQTATNYKYNSTVFYFPIWDKIYTNDEDRKMSLDQAREFDTMIRQAYGDLGYQMLDMPLLSVEQRADYIINLLQAARGHK